MLFVGMNEDSLVNVCPIKTCHVGTCKTFKSAFSKKVLEVCDWSEKLSNIFGHMMVQQMGKCRCIKFISRETELYCKYEYMEILETAQLKDF